MAYNEALAQRIREMVAGLDGLREQKMFGGIAFMAPGGMFCGVVGDDLMARPGPDRHDVAVARPGARIMDFAGRPMRGMVFVSPDGYEGDRLWPWVEESLSFVNTLPAKAPPRPRKRSKPA